MNYDKYRGRFDSSYKVLKTEGNVADIKTAIIKQSVRFPVNKRMQT